MSKKTNIQNSQSTPIPPLQDSLFLQTLKRYGLSTSKSRLWGNSVRPLTKKEISGLVAQGNHAEDWKKIFVFSGFSIRHVRNNSFIGSCVLGAYSGKPLGQFPHLPLPTGIYQSIIIGSEIGNNACVWNSCINNYLVNENSVVYNIGTLTCSPNAQFGNGREITLGNETGGREVLSFAEMSLTLANLICTDRGNTALMQAYTQFIKDYVSACSIGVGIVEAGCCLTNTNKIENSYIGPGAVIDGATLVSNCTVLSSAKEPVSVSSGTLIKDSCVQWGCAVSGMAIVQNSLLLEHSHVENHGKVMHSIIGPNSGIAEGEVTSSLVGPFVGFHHQALLIGALWPEGKGNVGYGANVGSNHTGKAPDQEIRCGEGTFFGLGTNIKFPADFSQAPYSLIATGVTTLPQRMEFPFSLINTPSSHFPDISPAFNEIAPGWVLSENSFAIKRNEAKFAARNKAQRTNITFEVLRPEIIDMMVIARNRLKASIHKKPFYTSKDILGLGKNILLEKSRLHGIEAYETYIEYYCLKGLCNYLGTIPIKNLAQVYAIKTKNARWEHERTLMTSEGFSGRTLTENLKRLQNLETHIAHAIQKAKEKDSARGEKIHCDYGYAHVAASKDTFIQQTWDAAHKVIFNIDCILKKL